MATLLSTDPLDALFDADGDIDLTNGIVLVSGPAGVAQLIDVAISIATEEWFLNLDQGMPWKQILGEPFNDAFLRQSLTNVISKVPGVVGTITLDITFDKLTRKVSVAWSVLGAFGDVISNTTTVGG